MNKEMTATLPTTETTNARNLGQKYETIRTANVVAFSTIIDTSTGTVTTAAHQPVDVRWYMARRSDGASPVYCSVWVHSTPTHCSGYGRASGYGYHKESAALAAALDSAGICLSERIDGVGDTAIREALSAVTRALGYQSFTIVGV